ncbi:hypothetical protein I302_101334 [Kwoniella bestiolae CBS 10118]|uniref:Uncharacterized protein n=1 Tax=Kwoniella bestiolae CBS 10118 TaxID=1296100 RepID=A0A1B9GBY8_9TREE|nr:hypothetical protein I302_00017 [Kwoniella bestiolae CBS 10118]OCF28530.1 hypothetical protein I302_00017 [Kwoniella bestiolae CBS 10118]
MPSYEEITAAGQAAESFLREYDSRMEGRRAEGDAGNVVPDVAWLRNACQKDNPDLQDKAWLLSLGLTPGTGSKEDGERAKERQHFLAIKAFALSATPMTENSACTDNATVDVTSFQSNPVAGADSFMEDCISEDQGLSDDDKYSFVSGCTNNSFSGDQFLEDDDFVVVKEASQCTSR